VRSEVSGRAAIPFTLVLLAALAGPATAAEPFKVFISNDMEGLTGVLTEDEVSRGKPEYEYFRGVLTDETNAAIEGAFAAGASEVTVREGHGGMVHLKLGMVDKRARVVRGPTHPQSMMVMMEGFDASYDAVVLIGYHASSGYPNSILPHTMGLDVKYFKINGVPLSEASYNALIAGSYDVPVVMLSGDKAACDEVRNTLGAGVETVAVKEALNGGIVTLHPQVTRAMIRDAVERGVRNRANIRPYKIEGPYTATLKMEKQGPLMPGATLNERGEAEFKSPDLLKALNAIVQMW
jgi:D-amino peptidase